MKSFREFVSETEVKVPTKRGDPYDYEVDGNPMTAKEAARRTAKILAARKKKPIKK